MYVRHVLSESDLNLILLIFLMKLICYRDNLCAIPLRVWNQCCAASVMVLSAKFCWYGAIQDSLIYTLFYLLARIVFFLWTYKIMHNCLNILLIKDSVVMNKLILSSCVISIFLVWPMFIRRTWPSLTHVKAIEHFNVSTVCIVPALPDILCLCFYSKPIRLLCEALVANSFRWNIPHQNHQKLQKSCVEWNFLLSDTEKSQGKQLKTSVFHLISMQCLSV